MNLILDISFLGTAYCGFQAQPSGNSIQQVLGRAASECFGGEVTVTGCSRTDSGVHANSYIVLLGLDQGCSSIPLDRVPLALNRFLPNDISVKSAISAPEGFHPRYSAHYKEYVYLINNSRTRDPFLFGRAHHYPRPLDIERMSEAAKRMHGKRDWRAFMASGSDITDTVRNVKYFTVEKQNDLVTLRVAADGFLYNMVRIMSGTLVAVSEGKLDPYTIDNVIDSLDRSKTGATLPSCGLYLNKVIY